MTTKSGMIAVAVVDMVIDQNLARHPTRLNRFAMKQSTDSGCNKIFIYDR